MVIPDSSEACSPRPIDGPDPARHASTVSRLRTMRPRELSDESQFDAFYAEAASAHRDGDACPLPPGVPLSLRTSVATALLAWGSELSEVLECGVVDEAALEQHTRGDGERSSGRDREPRRSWCCPRARFAPRGWRVGAGRGVAPRSADGTFRQPAARRVRGRDRAAGR